MGQSPEAAYAQRLELARAEAVRLDRRSALFANARGVAFLGAAVLALLGVFARLPSWSFGAAAFLFLCYALLAWRHGFVLAAEERARLRIALNERGLARLHGQWRLFPNKGERHLDSGHLYAPDLDLFGQGSLFQLLDETATLAGERRLAQWLLEPAGAEEIRERQGAIQELSALLDFRQALIAESRVAAQKKADPALFIAWCEGESLLRPIRWARPLACALPPVTLASFLLAQHGLLPPLWTVSLLLQLLVVVATRGRLGAEYGRISMGESGFVRFEETFATLERQRLEHPLLRRLQSSGPTPVSARLRRFSRLFSFAELRQSGQLHAVVNLLLLWDIQWLFRLEDWRVREGRDARAWFEALAELEALSSMAGFAFDRPDHAFPTLLGEGPCFRAKQLGHPLLDKAVRNDLELPGKSFALVITGSNMSGKTTLLRAIGINAVMAMAGLPVCAESLELSTLRVLTSMRVKDSLERGVSYFYAEVQRVKALLDAATAANGRALFLLDELLMGTNTRERQIASRELLKLLLRTGACGALTTHDLALTELEGERDVAVRNVHFEDRLEDGKMVFDYRLREGVVRTTNALRVLREAGIQVPEA